MVADIRTRPNRARVYLTTTILLLAMLATLAAIVALAARHGEAGLAYAVDPVPACPVVPAQDFPDGAGCDGQESTAAVGVSITGIGNLTCSLSGPFKVARSDVGDPGNHANVAKSSKPHVADRDDIATELIFLKLTGNCQPGAIQVTLRESPTKDSTGRIEEQDGPADDDLTFPADSFFDVFFEVDVVGITLHNNDPIRLECKIGEGKGDPPIPPKACVYEHVVDEPVPLFNESDEQVGVLTQARHTVTPSNKITVCLDIKRTNGLMESEWDKPQIDALVTGANDVWAQAGISISWNNVITPFEDPVPAGPGQKGDIVDFTKDLAEINALGPPNPNISGKEQCVRVFLIHHFVGNDGTKVGFLGAASKGPGSYAVLSIHAEKNPSVLAHELGHTFGLQHNEPDKSKNLMNASKVAGDTLLNQEQILAARPGAIDLGGKKPEPPVGGISVGPGVAGLPLKAPDSSGSSAGLLAGVASAAAGAFALGGAAWFARRRWMR